MTSKPFLLRLAVAVPVGILMAVGPALSQDSGSRGLAVSDWRRERIPVHSAIPEYPEDARRDRLEGEASVCFTVGSSGEIVRPKIRSSTHRIFKRPALKAIRASTFRPLEAGELESPFETCRTYRFKLDRLDPLFVSDESATPEAPLRDGAANLATNPPSADAIPHIEQDGLAFGRADARAAIAQDTLITEASPVPPAVPVCETRKRPGTRIDYTFCSTPEQQDTVREATERTNRSLREESHWRDQTIQEALMKNGYPRGAGLGPR
jgi:TonB family protein